MKNNFVVTAAIMAGLCFAGSGHLKSAHAGYWELKEHDPVNQYGQPFDIDDPDLPAWQAENASYFNGIATMSYQDLHGSQFYSFNWQDDVYQLHSGFGGPGQLMAWTDPGSTVEVTSDGKLRLRFHWVRDQINGIDDPNDNPPSTFRIQVSMSANAALAGSPQGGDVTNVNLETTVGEEDGESFAGDPILPTQTSGFYQSLVYWKSIPVIISSSNLDPEGCVWSPWFTYKAKAKGGISILAPSYNNPASIDFMFNWDYDTRDMNISSSAEPTYYKDENGVQQPNQRAENGSMTADVAAIWNDALNMWYWNGAFDANLFGSPWDSPTYIWTGSLLQYNQNNPNPGSVSSISNAQYILPSYTEAAGPGGAFSLAVSAEDTDGRYLVGTYAINFHKTHENDDEYKTQDEAPGVFIDGAPVIESITANPPYAIHNGSVNLNWTNTPYAAILDSNEMKIAADTLAILATGYAPAEVIAGAAGIAQTALSETNNQQPVSYNDCWYDNDPVSSNPTATWDFSSTRPDDTHLSEYRMIPHIHAGHKLHFIKYDGYDSHGYAGEKKLVVETLRSQAFYGEFIPLAP